MSHVVRRTSAFPLQASARYTLVMNSAKTASRAWQDASLDRRLFWILACVALIYAFCAGLRTVSDFDTGWQLATGRWVVQHHQVPSFDVLSYTAQGEPWVYPVGAGVLFYAVFLLGGFALLSWVSAAACVGTIALLLRRGSAVERRYRDSRGASHSGTHSSAGRHV